jgi:hypothetical protein
MFWVARILSLHYFRKFHWDRLSTFCQIYKYCKKKFAEFHEKNKTFFSEIIIAEATAFSKCRILSQEAFLKFYEDRMNTFTIFLIFATENCLFSWNEQKVLKKRGYNNEIFESVEYRPTFILWKFH